MSKFYKHLVVRMPEVAIYNLQNIKFQIVLVLVSCQTKSMWVILEIFHDVLGVPGPDVIGKIHNLQRIRPPYWSALDFWKIEFNNQVGQLIFAGYTGSKKWCSRNIVFCNVKNGSSNITTNNSPKNLSNENLHYVYTIDNVFLML